MKEMITGDEPAMPIIEDNNVEGHLIRMAHYPGLTIRQEFAARAMQGILANTEGAVLPNGHRTTHPDDIAMYAIICADALITRLNKPEKSLTE